MTHNLKKARLTIGFLLLCGALPACADDLDPSELMRHVQQQMSAPDETVRIRMKLTDASGAVRGKWRIPLRSDR